ncbi:hypothetical protein pb186bvf_013731 [Paramecium bursaria]
MCKLLDKEIQKQQKKNNLKNFKMQLALRLSPNKRINLGQKSQKPLKIQNELILDPLLDVTPFSELLEKRKEIYSRTPIQYIEQPRIIRTPRRTLPNKEESKSVRSKSVKSVRSLFQNSQASICSHCMQCGRPSKKVQRSTSKKRSQSKSYSKQSRSVQSIISADSGYRKTRKPTSSISSHSRQKGCPYHKYEQRSSRSVKKKIELIDYSRQQKQKNIEILQMRQQLQNQFSAKSLNPKQQDNPIVIVPWLADVNKIQEGLVKKLKMIELNKKYKEYARSKSKRELIKSYQIEELTRKKNILEKRKSLLKSKPIKQYTKSEREHIKRATSKLKEMKQNEKTTKEKRELSLKQIQEKAKECLKNGNFKRFTKPNELQLEMAFT